MPIPHILIGIIACVIVLGVMLVREILRQD